MGQVRAGGRLAACVNFIRGLLDVEEAVLTLLDALDQALETIHVNQLPLTTAVR